MVYTEFISSEAIIRDADIALHKMQFEEMERPFGIQIFGGEEEAMDGATRVAVANNPDLIDINFGCPVFKIVKKGAGSACLKVLGWMERRGGTVVDAAGVLPETVKTRLGGENSTNGIQKGARIL